MTSRNELKFLISEQQMYMIRTRVQMAMCMDSHAMETGHYNIRSLYFDSFDDSCFYDNLNGINKRKKYRLRIYDRNVNHIHLERKGKIRDRTLKEETMISQEEMYALILQSPIDLEGRTPFFQKTYTDILSNGYQPKVIVDYDRVPYVYPEQNVRVTFDMNISSCSNLSEFLEERLSRRPVLPIGSCLMEVKFDEYLPGIIRDLIGVPLLRQTAFSKYCMCRQLTV